MSLIKKYEGILGHVESQLMDTDREDFWKFLVEIGKLEKAAIEASETLDEVRTGEDFECVCSDKAREVRKVLGIKGEFDDE